MTITVAVVAYNEENDLPALLADIRAQSYDHALTEVLLIDSASTDRTREVMEDFCQKNDPGLPFWKVRVLDNPARRQSAGWNVAIREFSADALVRVDAHARIPEDFLASCVSSMEDEYVVGGARPTRVPDDGGAFATTLWMAEESMFGASVSVARRSADESDENTKRSYAKSLFHACYAREVLEKVGGFREDLGRTEDNEFHYRIRKAGYRIYNSPSIYSEQYIRPTLGKMLKQKAGNGFWVGRTLGIVPGCLSWYHFVPFLFVLAIVATVVMAVTIPWWAPLQILTALYLSACVLMSVGAAFSLQRAGEKVPGTAVLLPVLFFLLHTGYGAGTLAGIVSIPFGRGSVKNHEEE